MDQIKQKKSLKGARLPKVALIGRPNVGKSTLFNRLTRKKDALVDDTPGLTRDRRYGKPAESPCPFLLVDTGGIGADQHGAGRIAEQVAEQTMKALEESDLLVFMFDAAQGLHPEDENLLRMIRRSKKPFIAAANKVEGRRADVAVAEFYETGVAEIVAISARTGKGVAGLLDKICSTLKAHALADRPGGEPEEESGLSARDRGKEETDSVEGTSDTALSQELRQAEPDNEEEPIRVCIIGRPNVGKSSLLNRLVGEERMIVADQPGTTRDSIDTVLSRDEGADIVLVDTAGIRRRSKVRDKIEKFSVLKAIEAIKSSDIAVVVLDASEGVTDQDKRLIGYSAKYGKGCITLFNKWDLVKADAGMRRRLKREAELIRKVVPYAPHLNISALSGRNVSKLLPLIDQVYRDYSFRQTTGRLNRILKEALLRRNPPVVKGHFLKVYYATQVDVRPPTFAVFANYPELFPDHYRRFLANYFRKECGIPNTPVRIVFRQSH